MTAPQFSPDRPNCSPDAATLNALRGEVGYFGNQGKGDRERWVLKRWCSLTGRNAAAAVKGEAPDFTLGRECIEIAEVLHPDRERHKEMKLTLKAAKATPAEVTIHDGPSLATVQRDAQDWVLGAIKAKQKHYGRSANGWTLLLYVNFAFAERVDWTPVRSELTKEAVIFGRIEALMPDGRSHLTLFPNP